ncbi:MAG: hypothetical protein ACSHWQ_01480 [Spongiibacteraceae bacterium]
MFNTIDKTRRIRLQQLLDGAGSTASLAEMIGKSPTQISQWANASIDSKSGKPRVISNETARHIEKVLKKEKGWMDDVSSSDIASSILSSPTGQRLEALLKSLEESGDLTPELESAMLAMVQAVRSVRAPAAAHNKLLNAAKEK